MSEKQNRGIIERSKYDAMTTEELEDILRLDAEAPEEQESDTEMILYIMEVLTERKRNNGHTGKTALEAYESFVENYMPDMSDTDSEDPARRRTPAKRSRCSRWLRSLIAAAAVVAILLCGTVTAKAFGINIWEAVVQWTRETLQWGAWEKSNEDNDLLYASFQAALEKGNVPVNLVPTWIPDGFELSTIKVENNPLQKVYKAKYTKQEHNLVITVQDHLDNKPFYIEQSEGLVEEYEAWGITYYLSSNYGYSRAAWIYESYECDISGNVTIDELKKMIDSTQKG